MSRITEQTQQHTEQAAALRALWLQLFEELQKDGYPALAQFFVWLNRYSAEIVEAAIRATHFKAYRLSLQQKQMELDYQLRYASVVMRSKLGAVIIKNERLTQQKEK